MNKEFFSAVVYSRVLQVLAGEISPFMCSGSHLAQLDTFPSSVHTILEGVSKCSPSVPIRPCILKVGSLVSRDNLQPWITRLWFKIDPGWNNNWTVLMNASGEYFPKILFIMFIINLPQIKVLQNLSILCVTTCTYLHVRLNSCLVSLFWYSFIHIVFVFCSILVKLITRGTVLGSCLRITPVCVKNIPIIRFHISSSKWSIFRLLKRIRQRLINMYVNKLSCLFLYSLNLSVSVPMLVCFWYLCGIISIIQWNCSSLSLEISTQDIFNFFYDCKKSSIRAPFFKRL